MSKHTEYQTEQRSFPYIGFYSEAETLLQKESPAVASGALLFHRLAPLTTKSASRFPHSVQPKRRCSPAI